MHNVVRRHPFGVCAWLVCVLFSYYIRASPAARRALERAIAISPTDNSYHFALGQLDLLQGRLPEAQAEFQKQGTEAGRRTGYAMAEHASAHEKQSQSALKELIAKNSGASAYQIAVAYPCRADTD